MRKYTVAILVLAALCGAATSLARPATQANASGHAAWYVGLTSAGTRVDFRVSPSGLWVPDFHFGSPPRTCALSGSSMEPLVDGNFPLVGLRVSAGTFHGQLQAQDETPSTPDQPVADISGRFVNASQVMGTVVGRSRSCDTAVALTFTAKRVGALPARPVSGGRYAGRTVRGSSVRFQVSRSGRRVVAFRFAPIVTYRRDNGVSARLSLAHSYPAAGLARNRAGVFTGTLSSRLIRGRPAGTRVQVSVLFLSSREATGTVRLLGPRSQYETLPWRATLGR
jgi:hypothetical protein